MQERNDAVALTAVRVSKEILQRFRVAISKKHQGLTRGTTYIEFNNALETWTKVMNGEAEVVLIPKAPRAPIFAPDEKKR